MLRVDTMLPEGATSLSLFIHLIYYLVVVCLFVIVYNASKNPFTLANRTFVIVDLQSRDPSKI